MLQRLHSGPAYARASLRLRAPAAPISPVPIAPLKHQTDMTLEKSPSRSYFDGRCGPTLLVSLAVLVVVVFAIIFLFEDHNRQSSPTRRSHPITSGTPLK